MRRNTRLRKLTATYWPGVIVGLFIILNVWWSLYGYCKHLEVLG